MLIVSVPLTRLEITLSAHAPAPVSAHRPFRTQSNFHIRSWTCFLFLFSLFSPSFSTVSAVQSGLLAYGFVAQELPFYHRGQRWRTIFSLV